MPTSPHLVKLSEHLRSADIALSPSQLERKMAAKVAPLDDAPEAKILAFYRIVERFAGRGRSGNISADDLTTLEAARDCIPSKRLRDVITRLGGFEPCLCNTPDPDPTSPAVYGGSRSLSWKEAMREQLTTKLPTDETFTPLIKRLGFDAARNAEPLPTARGSWEDAMVALEGVSGLLTGEEPSDVEVDAIGAVLGIDASAGLTQMLGMALANQLEVFAHASEQDLANAVKLSYEMVPWATAELGINQPQPDWRLIAAGVPAILVHVESIRAMIAKDADPGHAFAILLFAMTQPDVRTALTDPTEPGDSGRSSKR